jgi:hypothetical protein
MNQQQLLSLLADTINQVVIADDSGRCVDAQYDGDNDSGELVIVTDGGEEGRQEYIISSVHVRALEDDELDQEPLESDRSYAEDARDGRFE